MKILPLIVGVCGASGSGKSYFSDHFADELRQAYKPIRVEHFSLDRYYLGIAEKTSTERASHNFDHPNQIDYPLFEKHLRELRKGISADIPNYDYAKSCRTEKTDRVEPCDVLITDGLHLFHKDSIRELFTLKIFVHTPLDECEQRRVIRDISERGQSEKIVRYQYQKNVIPMFKEYIEPKQEFADLVIQGTDEISTNNRIVLKQLAPLLKK